MNGADSCVPDPYVQEFMLDQFSNMAIKPEIIYSNSAGDSNLNDDGASAMVPITSSASTMVGLPEEDLLLRRATPDNVVVSHLQIPHRLLPTSLLHSQASPPPHLLTPPESQDDYYPPLHHHHQMMSGNAMTNGNLVISGNLPDTPPIGSPPPPSAIDHHPGHLHIQPQYPSLQAIHHPHQPSGELAEDTLWLSQSSNSQLPRQEPLDLRPHCNGDSVQNWNMMQQHTSVITAPGKRIYHTDYYHHHASLGQYPTAGQLPAFGPLLTASSISPSSSSSLSLSLTSTSTKSLVAHNGLGSHVRSADGRASAGFGNSGRNRARTGAASKTRMAGANRTDGNTADEERPRNPEVKIEDDLLLKITVRDLNNKLKGTTKDQQTKTKQRRRTLKNRIYAQNCRNKRNEQKTKLEVAKSQLEREVKNQIAAVSSLQRDVVRLQNDLARERQINNSLRNELGKLLDEAERRR